MNILVLPSWYPPQGGSFFLGHSKFLQTNENVNVSILYAEYRSLLKEKRFYPSLKFSYSKKKEDGILTYRTKYWKFPKFEKLNSLLWVRKSMKLFEKFITEQDAPDIILVHSSIWAGIIATRIKKKYGIPFVIVEHRGRFTYLTNFAKKHFKNWYHKYLKNIVSNSSKILLVSKLLLNKYNDYIEKKDFNKFVVLSNMIDTSFFSFFQREYCEKQIFNFLIVAGLQKVKAIDILIEAFEKLNAENQQISLSIVGEGEERKQLETQIKKLKLTKKITLKGFLTQKEVIVEMKNAHCLIISSYAESGSFVILEATSTGMPVIASSVVTDDIVPKESGYIVEHSNPEKLYITMKKMMENYNNFDKKQIRKYTEENFDYKIVSKKTINELTKIVENN